MSDRLRTICLLGATAKDLEWRVDRALTGIAPDRIVSISYSTSRIFTIWLQHHVLIVVREE
jgi:hypothetical protein